MSMLNALGSYDDIWKAIISPNRQEYNLYDLGPTDITIQGNKIRRTDFRLLNKRGFSIQCSYFQQANINTAIPCVVYLHANGCSRLEALQYLDIVLSNPVSFFCFDFSGCGKSDGLYTSVGWYEQDDLECVVQYLYNTSKVSKIAVWGRSMGSITALMYASKDPRINCLIFDSPFANFKRFVKELVKNKAPIPDFVVSGAFQIIRTTIKKKANFDIDALRPVKYIDKIAVPALFGAAKDDIFVSNEHTKELFMSYGGHKQLMIFEGDHNSERPANWKKLVKEFLRFHLLGEKHESQIPKKSIKNLFNNAEKLQEPHVPVSTLGLTQNFPQYTPAKPTSNSASQPPQQNHMTFSWLDNNASSPTLSGSHASQSSGHTDKAGNFIHDKAKAHQSGNNKIAEKKLGGLFSPQASGQQHSQQSASQHKQDSPRLASRGYIGHINAKSNEQAANSPIHISKSISENQPSVSIFGPKENKPKSTSTFDSSLNHLDTPKVSISLKDSSSYRLNNPLGHQMSTEKSKLKIFGPSSHAKSPQSSIVPSVSVSLSNIQKTEASDHKLYSLTPSSNYPAQRRLDSQKERARKIFDKGSGSHSASAHTIRPASSGRSFTSAVNSLYDHKISKENPILKESSKKGLYVDVHSNVSIATPLHTVPNAHVDYTTSGLSSVGHLDARRISDNQSHLSHFEEYKRSLLVRDNGNRG